MKEEPEKRIGREIPQTYTQAQVDDIFREIKRRVDLVPQYLVGNFDMEEHKDYSTVTAVLSLVKIEVENIRVGGGYE